MKKILMISAVVFVAAPLAGCNNSPEDRALGGAALGGVAGAAIGGAATGRVGGALAGGVIGAVAGGVLGGVTAPQRRARCARYGYDYDGNYVCVEAY